MAPNVGHGQGISNMKPAELHRTNEPMKIKTELQILRGRKIEVASVEKGHVAENGVEIVQCKMGVSARTGGRMKRDWK